MNVLENIRSFSSPSPLSLVSIVPYVPEKIAEKCACGSYATLETLPVASGKFDYVSTFPLPPVITGPHRQCVSNVSLLPATIADSVLPMHLKRRGHTYLLRPVGNQASVYFGSICQFLSYPVATVK